MKTCYLTVDDGPSTDFELKVQFLLTHKVPAIFFCLGYLLAERQEDVIRAIRQGFVIGNHSYSHPKFSEIAISDATEEIARTDRLIDRLYLRAGMRRPMRVFRFPHGDKGNEETRPVFQRILRDFGYRQPRFREIRWYGGCHSTKAVDTHWTYNTKDYTVARFRRLGAKSPYGVSSKKAVLARMDEHDPRDGKGLNSTRTNDIVLAHDDEIIADVFVAIVKKLLQKDIALALPGLGQRS